MNCLEGGVKLPPPFSVAFEPPHLVFDDEIYIIAWIKNFEFNVREFSNDDDDIES